MEQNFYIYSNKYNSFKIWVKIGKILLKVDHFKQTHPYFLLLLPSKFWNYFCPKYKDTKIFENQLNPVILVFIW